MLHGNFICSRLKHVFRHKSRVSNALEDPIANILLIPGGLVEAESYEYLAYNLALADYDVTIFKPLFGSDFNLFPSIISHHNIKEQT